MFITLVLLLLSLQGPQQTGSVSGRVIDADTQAPVAGAKVGSRETGYTTTDADGRYTLSNIAAGPVTIEAEDSRYIDMMLNPSKRLVVTPNREHSGVDFRTRLDAQISGKVVDAEGNPLPGIRVTVIERRYGQGRLAGTESEYGFGDANYQSYFGRGVVTDDRGLYNIRGSLFGGRHYLILAQPDNRNSNPISDAPANPEARKPTLIPTYYPAAASVTSAVAVTPHSLEHRENVDIRMLTAPAFCLEATLSGSGVLRYGLEPEEIHQMNRGSPPNSIGTAGPDGKIRVCNLYPGEFRLSAFTDLPRPTGYASLPIVISNTDVRGLKLDAVRPVPVRGEVVWDSPPPDAVAKSTFIVRERPRFAPSDPFSGPVRIGIPGSLSFDALQGIPYSLWLAALPAPLYVKDILYNGESILGKPIVAGSSSANVRLIVAHDGGTIRTRVNTPGAVVFILPASAQSQREVADTMVSGFADDDNLFVAHALPPGRYYVLATSDPPPLRVLRATGDLLLEKTPETIARLHAARPRGTLVNLGAGSSAEVSVTVQPIP